MDENKLGRKFKAGDKVRVLSTKYPEASTERYVGDMVSVLGYKNAEIEWFMTNPKRPVVVDDDGTGNYGYFEESALELVEEEREQCKFKEDGGLHALEGTVVEITDNAGNNTSWVIKNVRTAGPNAQPSSTPTVYLAAPISTDGDIMYVNHLASELRTIGYNVYSPIEDASINDKSRNPQSTDIYGNDTNGIDNADIVLVVESGREQVGTHVELGKVLKAIEGGSNVKLIAFTNNKRLQSPQIEDGLPSASMNAFAYGGIKQHGTWVSGGTDGLLTYMRELIGADSVEPATDDEKLVTKGDDLVDSYDYTICTVLRLDDVYDAVFPYFVMRDYDRSWIGDDVLISDYAKLLEDGRVYEWASDLTFANIDAYKRYKEAK